MNDTQSTPAPCPFCGSTDVDDLGDLWGWAVYCNKCKARGPYSRSQQASWDAWKWSRTATERAEAAEVVLAATSERCVLLTRTINAIYTIVSNGREPADTVTATIRALMDELGIEVQP